MHKEQRQKNLIDYLSENNIMTISELAKQLDTSMMTIRRDIEYLEQQGIVKKLHGGALLIKHDPDQPSFYERIEELDNEKKRIGKAAAEFVKYGSIVFFDAGTSPLAVIEHIPNNIEFTAISTGLMTSVALCSKPKANIISIGGNIHPSSYSSINYLAIDLIQRFHADIAFISTKAVSVDEGTFEAQLPLIEVKKAIVKASNKVILLVDHSKFEAKSLCLSIPMGDIDTIVTDNKVSDETIVSLKNAGKEVIVV